MKQLVCKVTVGNYSFAPSGVEIKSSWATLTDTCDIQLPKKIHFQGKELSQGVASIFRKGDVVKVEAGYNDELNIVFLGVLSKIGADTPIRLKCEDLAYHLKLDNHNVSYKDIDLEGLLNDVCQVPYEVTANWQLGKFRASNSSTAKILDHLRKNYGTKAWTRNGMLYVGNAYNPELANHVIVDINRNVVREHLIFAKADDLKIKVKVISIDRQGVKTEVTEGDQSGSQRTFHFYNKSKETLTQIAQEKLKHLRYDGYTGSIEMFGKPWLQHGDVVTIKDEIYPEREGKYYVKEVVTTIGAGMRQRVAIDIKVS